MSINEAELEAYRQANEELRFFSGMRYSVLGAFTAISGGLFVVASEHLEHHRPAFLTLALFNCGVSLACTVLEWRINDVAEFYANKVDDLARHMGLSPVACSAPSRTALGKFFGLILPYVVYFGSAIMWVYATLELMPNQSTDPTLSSVTPAAVQPARHP